MPGLESEARVADANNDQPATQVPEGLTAEDWASVQCLYREARYYLTWHEPSQGYVGFNVANGWSIRQQTEGFTIAAAPTQGWSVKLSLTGYGRGGAVQLSYEPALSVDNNRVEYQHGNGLTEWYVNDPKGVEQGFTIVFPPVPASGGAVVIEMAIDTPLFPVLESGGTVVAFHDGSGHTVLSYGGLDVVDAAGRQLPAELILSQDECRLSISLDDHGAVYPITVDPWLLPEQKKLTATDGAVNDIFGVSISIYGDTMAVGASCDDSYKGSTYVFTRNQGGADNWGQVKKLTASDGASDDQFGCSVSLSGDTVVVGAWEDDSSKGSTYVFTRNQGGADNWGQVKKLTASDGASFDYFGQSVSNSGDTVVVGAYEDDSGMGSAYVFTRNQGGADNWGQVKKLTASDGVSGDYFGCSVSISGDTVVVGALYANSHTGAIYMFARNQGGADNWGQMRKLTASDGAVGDYFGISVSINGDIVVVGACQDDVGGNSDQGSAYVFARNQGGADLWGQVKKITASDGAVGDDFGISVSINEDIIAVGAYTDDVGGNSDQGSAYLFARNNGGADNWSQVRKLTASDGASIDSFGSSVSLGGNTVAVGAYRDNVGGKSNQGSAYVFTRSEGNWTEICSVNASDGTVGDSFGSSVSLGGDIVAVGAYRDDVGGNSDQGSAYVFMRNQGGANNWGQVKKLTGSDGTASNYFGFSISLSGDTVIVGAPGDGSNKGAVYVFALNTGGVDNWGQVKKITASDGAAGDNFGVSVSISGDTVAVGAYMDDVGGNSDQGSVYVFARNTGGVDNWGQVKQLTAADGATSDFFSSSVSLDGDTIAVGSYHDNVGANTDEGSAYVFARNTGGADNWGQVKQLTAADGAANDCFGVSISMDGDTIVVGSYHDYVGANTDQGSSYVFARNTGGADNWGQVKQLKATDGTASNYFGFSISLSGDTVIVGAPGDGSNKGAVYVFARNTGGADNWGQVKKLTAADGASSDYFGYSISISGNAIVAGAYLDDVGANTDQGSTYIYQSNTPPEIKTAAVTTTLEDALYSVDYDVNDLEGDLVTWLLLTNASWLSIVASTGVLSGMPENDDVGSYHVNITGSDGHGGFDQQNFTLTVQNVNDAPVITTPDNTIATEDVLYIVDYNGTDVDPTNDFLTWTVTTNASWLSIASNTGILSGLAVQNDIGTYWVTVNVSDGKGGFDITSFTLTVQNLNDAPVITTPDNTIATEDVLYIVDYNGTDVDPTNDVLTWTVATNASWLSIASDTGILSGTPENDDVGSYDVNITGSDGHGGFDQQNFTLTVQNVNDAPVITTPDNTIATEDVLYIVDYNGTDVDPTNDFLTWTVTTNASWLSIASNTGILSGLAVQNDIGTYWVTVNVSDGKGGFDITSFTLTVQNLNDAPVIMTSDSAIATEDVLYLVYYEGTDVDPTNDVLTWTVATNASWLSITSKTGILYGMPTNGGRFWVNVSVSDGNGGRAWHYFILVVQDDAGGTTEPEPADNLPLIIASVALIIAGIDLVLRFKKPKKQQRTPPEPAVKG